MAGAAPLAIDPAIGARPALPPPGQRIALAHDQAFSFIYPHLIAAWRDGAEILPFSPLADEPPPESADCCWLPGGYPELHAAKLAAGRHFAMDYGVSRRRARCMVSAAATWCWDKVWKMPKDNPTP